MTVKKQHQASTQDEKPGIYYGFDLSKRTFESASRRTGLSPIQPETLQKMKAVTFSRTADGIKEWWEQVVRTLEPGEKVAVVMEVTSSYSLETAAWLKQVCPQVQLSILAGSRIRKWAEGIGIDDKSDKIDARVLACFGAERQPSEYVPLEGVYAQIRPLTRVRAGLVDQRVAIRQQLQEAKSEHLHAGTAKFVQSGYERIERTLDKQIARLEAEIEKLVRQDSQLCADVQLLDQIAGVGWITAVTVLAELGDLRRFGKRSRLVAMAGLNPVLRTSGTSVNKRPRISKKGSARARRALFLGVFAAITGDNMFAAAYNQLVSRGKKKMQALTAVMRKMLLVMRAVLISGHVLPSAGNPKARATSGDLV